MYEEIKFSKESMKVDVIHDARHKLDNVPFARESIPYTLHIPELQIAAFTYTWVNYEGEAGAAFALFGPGLGVEPIQQRISDRKISDEMDFSDWKIDNFRMQQDLKFRRAEISWETPQASIHFTFDALHPPYSYGSHAQGCPDFCAVDRVEQAGFVDGEILLGKKRIPFKSFAHRDHSWGSRRWQEFQFYHWFEGKSKDGSIAVHFWRYLAHGVESIRGYVLKEGMLAEITSVQTDIEYESLWQKKISLIVFDDAGRRTNVDADFYAHHPLIPSEEIELREAAGSATFDGKQGLAWLEVGWPSDYLKHQNTTK